jgi:outer membrane lipopolysaccharide assembly protein LptE/RlpB
MFLFKPIICSFILSLLLIALSACTPFHLRTQERFPPQLRQLYLITDEPYGSFETALRASLKTSGVQLVERKDQAPITLHITRPLLSQSSKTPGGSSQVRVYNMRYRVMFSLEDRNGKVLLPLKSLVALRALTLSVNQLLESNNELNLLVEDMQRDIINQLYNRLSSQQVAALVATSHETLH